MLKMLQTSVVTGPRTVTTVPSVRLTVFGFAHVCSASLTWTLSKSESSKR